MARIARARKGETIDELAARLFNVADPKTGMKAAAEHLVAANRHLALKGRGKARALADDAMVLVPEVEGAEPDRRVAQPLARTAARELLKRTREAVERLGPALDATHDEAIEELKETLELADSELFQSMAREDEALARRLESVRGWSMRRIEEVDRARDQQRVVLAEAADAITELVERTAGT